MKMYCRDGSRNLISFGNNLLSDIGDPFSDFHKLEQLFG